jgi:hypothetical protein
LHTGCNLQDVYIMLIIAAPLLLYIQLTWLPMPFPQRPNCKRPNGIEVQSTESSGGPEIKAGRIRSMWKQLPAQQLPQLIRTLGLGLNDNQRWPNRTSCTQRSVLGAPSGGWDESRRVGEVCSDCPNHLHACSIAVWCSALECRNTTYRHRSGQANFFDRGCCFKKPAADGEKWSCVLTILLAEACPWCLPPLPQVWWINSLSNWFFSWGSSILGLYLWCCCHRLRFRYQLPIELILGLHFRKWHAGHEARLGECPKQTIDN